MPANTVPLFTLTPVVAIATIVTANAGRDGTGTIVQVVAGGTNGTRIEFITIHATVTTTAGTVRLFVDPNTGTYHLWKEILVSAITASATVAAFDSEVVRGDGLPLITLPSGWKIGAATEKAENMRVIAHGGDY